MPWGFESLRARKVFFLKSGKIVGQFTVVGKDGERVSVAFRFPKMADAKPLLRFINRVRDQADFLGERKHETLASEKKFLKERLKRIRQHREILLFAESGGKIVGTTDISPSRLEVMAHVGNFGIALFDEFTGLGIGTRLAKCALRLAKTQTSFKIINSNFFSKNLHSKKLHKKLGFKKYGALPAGAKLRGRGYGTLIYVYKKI